MRSSWPFLRKINGLAVRLPEIRRQPLGVGTIGHLRQPETQERLARIGLAVMASSQGGLTEVLRRDVPKWGKAVKDSGAVSDWRANRGTSEGR